MRLSHLSDDQIRSALREHGSGNAAADALGVTRSSLQRARHERGLQDTVVPIRSRRQSMPKLTRESLHRALEPPNNCRVKAFLDQLDQESREAFEEGLGYSNSDFPAPALRRWLIGEGYSESFVPGEDAIKDHRAGRKPCRCR